MHRLDTHPPSYACLAQVLPVQPAIAIVDVESGETRKSVGEVCVHHARAHTQPWFDNPPSWVSAIWTNVKSPLNDVSPRPGASGRPRPVALCSAMVCSPSIRAAKKLGGPAVLMSKEKETQPWGTPRSYEVIGKFVNYPTKQKKSVNRFLLQTALRLL